MVTMVAQSPKVWLDVQTLALQHPVSGELVLVALEQ
jgi:hypothetical protein